MRELRGRAPAKVNLVMEVLGKRPDGYHDVATVLQTMELADELTLSPGDGALTITGPYAAGAPADSSNLVARAAAALREGGVRLPSLDIHIEKQIPAAAGLGGGASDAATALRLLQAELGLTEDVVQAAAVQVGSDESFFLQGGTALASGRGERITPLPDLAPHGVVLFVPPWTIEEKTARMFRALAGYAFDDGAVARSFRDHPPERVAASDIHNAFERVAFEEFPALGPLHDQLEELLEDAVRLAGAGPTLFWIGPLGRAAAVAAKARGAACTVIETRTARSLWKR